MKALVNYMKASGLSQAELARKLGLNQGQLNHWIHGRRVPRIDSLKRISAKTGMSLETLTRDL